MTMYDSQLLNQFHGRERRRVSELIGVVDRPAFQNVHYRGILYDVIGKGWTRDEIIAVVLFMYGNAIY